MGPGPAPHSTRLARHPAATPTLSPPPHASHRAPSCSRAHPAPHGPPVPPSRAGGRRTAQGTPTPVGQHQLTGSCAGGSPGHCLGPGRPQVPRKGHGWGGAEASKLSPAGGSSVSLGPEAGIRSQRADKQASVPTDAPTPLSLLDPAAKSSVSHRPLSSASSAHSPAPCSERHPGLHLGSRWPQSAGTRG